MKKVLMVSLIALASVSCSKGKDYTCECVNRDSQGVYISTTSSTEQHKSLEEAQDDCAKHNGVGVSGISHSCSLK